MSRPRPVTLPPVKEVTINNVPVVHRLGRTLVQEESGPTRRVLLSGGPFEAVGSNEFRPWTASDPQVRVSHIARNCQALPAPPPIVTKPMSVKTEQVAEDHYVHDVYLHPGQLTVELEVPSTRMPETESVTVPWVVEEEIQDVEDETQIVYEDHYYWLPVYMYNALHDKAWTHYQHEFTELVSRNCLPPDAIEMPRGNS